MMIHHKLCAFGNLSFSDSLKLLKFFLDYQNSQFPFDNEQLPSGNYASEARAVQRISFQFESAATQSSPLFPKLPSDSWLLNDAFSNMPTRQYANSKKQYSQPSQKDQYKVQSDQIKRFYEISGPARTTSLDLEADEELYEDSNQPTEPHEHEDIKPLFTNLKKAIASPNQFENQTEGNAKTYVKWTCLSKHIRAAVDNYKSPPRRRQDKTGDRQRTRSPPLDTAIPFLIQYFIL
ncbi:unnamed protein product [Caenorhabditis auriculariae]|uniref:Uncharacterized protein n=1 Tax=Caenorhabditis auriculariae TaxID=2777116 RepID=A0A8S1H1B0_9PELO|nr:unnamed protein product [Caenorhabditis auriculariae]